MNEKLESKLTIRLFAEEKCFGPGVAELLHLVDKCHSLRSAAAEMSMAYSKAWKIVRQAEEVLGCKLLLSTTGGRGGGGATLSTEAVELLRAYDAYSQALRQFSREIFPQHFRAFLFDETSEYPKISR